MTANAPMTSTSTPAVTRCGHLALALATVIAAPSVAAAAPGPTIAATVAGSETPAAAVNPQAVLDVDVALGESDGEILGKRLQAEATTALGESDVDIVQGAAVSKITVEVRWDDDENHAITVRVTNRGEATEVVEGSPFICDACGENELITKIREVVPACVPLLAVQQTSPEPVVDPPPGGDDPGPEDRSTKRPLKAIGKAGIALMAVGVGGVAGGAVMLALGERADPNPPDPSNPETTDFRPPGIAVLAVGGALLLTGVGLLVADRVSAKKHSAVVAPAIGPRFTGLAISARF